MGRLSRSRTFDLGSWPGLTTCDTERWSLTTPPLAHAPRDGITACEPSPHSDVSGNLQDGLWGPRKLKWGYTQVFGYTKAVGSPTGATHGCLSMPRRLDPQTGLRTGVWIPNCGYTWVFGFPTAATHRCLDPQPGLHTGVWSPNRGYTRVFGVPNGRLCKLPQLMQAQHWP